MSTDFLLTNGGVFLTNYSSGEETILEIRQKDCFESMMSIFEFIWAKAIPFSEDS